MSRAPSFRFQTSVTNSVTSQPSTSPLRPSLFLTSVTNSATSQPFSPLRPSLFSTSLSLSSSTTTTPANASLTSVTSPHTSLIFTSFTTADSMAITTVSTSVSDTTAPIGITPTGITTSPNGTTPAPTCTTTASIGTTSALTGTTAALTGTTAFWANTTTVSTSMQLSKFSPPTFLVSSPGSLPLPIPISKAKPPAPVFSAAPIVSTCSLPEPVSTSSSLPVFTFSFASSTPASVSTSTSLPVFRFTATPSSLSTPASKPVSSSTLKIWPTVSINGKGFDMEPSKRLGKLNLGGTKRNPMANPFSLSRSSLSSSSSGVSMAPSQPLMVDTGGALSLPQNTSSASSSSTEPINKSPHFVSEAASSLANGPVFGGGPPPKPQSNRTFGSSSTCGGGGSNLSFGDLNSQQSSMFETSSWSGNSLGAHVVKPHESSTTMSPEGLGNVGLSLGSTMTHQFHPSSFSVSSSNSAVSVAPSQQHVPSQSTDPVFGRGPPPIPQSSRTFGSIGRGGSDQSFKDLARQQRYGLERDQPSSMFAASSEPGNSLGSSSLTGSSFSGRRR